MVVPSSYYNYYHIILVFFHSAGHGVGSCIRIHMHVATGLKGCHEKQRHPPHTTSLRHQSCYHHRPIHFEFNLVTTTPQPNLCKCPAPMRLFCHPCCLRLGGSTETMCRVSLLSNQQNKDAVFWPNMKLKRSNSRTYHHNKEASLSDILSYVLHLTVGHQFRNMGRKPARELYKGIG